jgi:hypothetical protein
MATVVVSKSARTQSGRKVTYSHQFDTDGVVSKDPELAAAKTGTLTTRTNGTTGTLTMTAGHGLSTGDKIDIYWSGGIAYNVTVGTVATNSVPIASANGDALPVVGTAVTVMVPTSYEFAFDNANLKTLMVGCDGIPMVARFRSAVPADIVAILVRPGGDGGYIWESNDPATGSNPLTADPATVFLSHGSSSAARRPIAEAVVV